MILGTTLEFVVSAGLVLLLVIFMLLNREDLRNRFIRLMGETNMSSSIKTLDDVGQRISRFLLMQLIVNGTYGIGLGHRAVPHRRRRMPSLWGFLAAVLRYIPYLGPWLAAVFPLALSWAIYPRVDAARPGRRVHPGPGAGQQQHHGALAVRPQHRRVGGGAR